MMGVWGSIARHSGGKARHLRTELRHSRKAPASALRIPSVSLLRLSGCFNKVGGTSARMKWSGALAFGASSCGPLYEPRCCFVLFRELEKYMDGRMPRVQSPAPEFLHDEVTPAGLRPAICCAVSIGLRGHSYESTQPALQHVPEVQRGRVSRATCDAGKETWLLEDYYGQAPIDSVLITA